VFAHVAPVADGQGQSGPPEPETKVLCRQREAPIGLPESNVSYGLQLSVIAHRRRRDRHARVGRDLFWIVGTRSSEMCDDSGSAPPSSAPVCVADSFPRLRQMADMSCIKAKERGRQVHADLGCHRSNGSLDFCLGDGHQTVMLSEHLGPRALVRSKLVTARVYAPSRAASLRCASRTVSRTAMGAPCLELSLRPLYLRGTGASRLFPSGPSTAVYGLPAELTQLVRQECCAADGPDGEARPTSCR